MENTMHQIKTISSDAVARALQKAERYRLLNQSWATESICLDILKVDPENQQVRVMYLLSLTDQFGAEPGDLARRARGELAHITDEYQRAYYAGIIDERLGHAKLAHGVMHAEGIARKLFLSAMESFERAEALRKAGNDDAILRWNTCARTLERLRLEEEPEVQHAPQFGE
ncbi:MAG: hypothetical protein JWO05_227 [Gemmatimonadetes bacterium]|nr:hypothetical protein [Gemmatimonadota bacterium]